MEMNKNHYFSFIFLCGIFCHVVLGREGCPPPEDVKPCVCNYVPFPILECFHIKDDEELRFVFEHSQKYTYRQVHISFSSLEYLPKGMFENTIVKELYIRNSTLNALFDSPPDGLRELFKLHIENTQIKELSHWKLISRLTTLEQLVVLHNPIEYIDSTFGDYVPKDIRQLTLVETGTKEIAEGAFLQFRHLDKIEISVCKLKRLSRGYFPNPFNVEYLYFNDNELTTIPNDLFSNMPKLISVGLRNNFLKTIPESAFDGVRVRSIHYFSFEGNPWRCDCSLLWLVKNKPHVLKGSCATPIRLHGKKLRHLDQEDFRCSRVKHSTIPPQMRMSIPE